MKTYSEEEYPKQQITEKIIKAAFIVHNRLGASFVEKVYENALARELRVMGLDVQQQKPMKVTYGGEPVGEFIADLLVEQSVIVELKAVRRLEKPFEDKLLHYLRTTSLPVGLLVNFGGPSVEVKRKVNFQSTI